MATDPRLCDRPWHANLTIDLIARVLRNSIFHPFIAWLIPLCMRAQATSYGHPKMQMAIGYAILISVWSVLTVLDKRTAYGLAREVDLAKEVIVITGGASGLGLLIAEVYGMRGASVAVLDVRQMDGESAGVEYYECDVGDRAQVQKAAKMIEEDLGPPTILINNAGIVNGKALLDLSAAELERNFRVNLLSHFYTLQTFLPGMLRQKRGTIVTVSSVLAHLGCKSLCTSTLYPREQPVTDSIRPADYTAAKAGLIALHASVTAELPSEADIKTLLVTPGQLSTPLFAGVRTPSNFFAPVVEPVEVAKEIIAAVDGGMSGEISLPLYARWIKLLGVLPPGLQQVIRWASGMDPSMDDFVGRRGPGEKRSKASTK